MYYAISTSGFEVRRFDSLYGMLDEMDTAFMSFHGFEAEYSPVCEPTPEQTKVLELAMAMMEVTWYFPGQLEAKGYKFFAGTAGDYAGNYKDRYAPTYNCLRSGRFMDAKMHRQLVDAFLELPPLSALCGGDVESPDFHLFKRLINAMLDFTELGRYTPEQTSEWVDDSDIPF